MTEYTKLEFDKLQELVGDDNFKLLRNPECDCKQSIVEAFVTKFLSEGANEGANAQAKLKIVVKTALETLLEQEYQNVIDIDKLATAIVDQTILQNCDYWSPKGYDNIKIETYLRKKPVTENSVLPVDWESLKKTINQ